MYNLLKFIHVVSAIAWFGGIIMLFLLNNRFARAGNQDLVKALGQQGAALSMTFFMPAAIVALVTGIAMVMVGRLDFGATWISWGFLGFILSMIIGGVLTGGTARRLAKAVQAGSATQEDIARAQKRINLYVRLNLLVLLSVVWAMVAKP